MIVPIYVVIYYYKKFFFIYSSVSPSARMFGLKKDTIHELFLASTQKSWIFKPRRKGLFAITVMCQLSVLLRCRLSGWMCRSPVIRGNNSKWRIGSRTLWGCISIFSQDRKFSAASSNYSEPNRTYIGTLKHQQVITSGTITWIRTLYECFYCLYKSHSGWYFCHTALRTLANTPAGSVIWSGNTGASFVLETLSLLRPESLFFGGAWLVVTNSDKDHTSVKFKLQRPDCVVLIRAEVLCQGLGSIYQFSSALSLSLSSVWLTIISMWLKA